MRREGAWVVLFVALAATAWDALHPGDEAAAAQAWQDAKLGGDDLTRPIYVSVSALQRDIAPWQASWGEARARAEAIEMARRAALPHDRGGRRSRVPMGLAD